MSKLFSLFPKSWSSFLGSENCQQKLEAIEKKLNFEKQIIFPELKNIFHAFELVEPEKVKVVILGQDPYHGEGEAMGLSFSVPKGVKLPPSLKNIYKELESSLNIKNTHGDLTNWAKQGVLLLNSVLTVTKDIPASHKKIGWMDFTDLVIRKIANQSDRVIFMLWGNFAHSKSEFIGANHVILKSAHPSPFSARLGFFGCDHFKICNQELKKMKQSEIDWQV